MRLRAALPGSCCDRRRQRRSAGAPAAEGSLASTRGGRSAPRSGAARLLPFLFGATCAAGIAGCRFSGRLPQPAGHADQREAHRTLTYQLPAASVRLVRRIEEIAVGLEFFRAGPERRRWTCPERSRGACPERSRGGLRLLRLARALTPFRRGHPAGHERECFRRADGTNLRIVDFLTVETESSVPELHGPLRSLRQEGRAVPDRREGPAKAGHYVG